ncbi:MAG: tail fiber domain-containing protein [Bdellovibrionales bacterium]
MIKRLQIKANRRRGFTLIELAIVLAITSLLTAGLWRMMSSGQSQIRDQAAADQQKELINAVRGYLASETGQTHLYASASKFLLSLDDSGLAPYLPTGFTSSTTNAYGQIYQVHVVKTPAAANTRPTSYSFMIKTVNGTTGETIPDTSGGRISSMIGSDGGFVYAASVCGTAGAMACGAYGTWSAAPTTVYGFDNTAGGQIASRTFVGSSAETNAPWLARLDMDSASSDIHDLNTIQTDISLGGNTIYGTTSSSYGGAIVNMETVTLEDDDGASLTINSGTSCSKDTPTDNQNLSTGGCPNVAQFNGDVGIGGLLSAWKLYAQQFVYDTSDRRLKHDIKPLTNILDKMAKLTAYSFKMNNGDNEKYGVIAQEVEKVFPILVQDIGDGYIGVDYIGMIGPLVASVNELNKQNQELKAALERQEKMIKKLQKQKAK